MNRDHVANVLNLDTELLSEGSIDGNNSSTGEVGISRVVYFTYLYHLFSSPLRNFFFTYIYEFCIIPGSRAKRPTHLPGVGAPQRMQYLEIRYLLYDLPIQKVLRNPEGKHTYSQPSN